MNTTTKSLSDDASKLIQQGLDDLTNRGMDALRDSGEQIRQSGQYACHHSTDHIRHDPIKSVLIAAAVGAGLMGLLTMASHLKGEHRTHRGSGQ